MLLAINTFFDDELPSVNYVNATVISVKITDSNPNRLVKVENGALLKLIAIGDLTLTV